MLIADLDLSDTDLSDNEKRIVVATLKQHSSAFSQAKNDYGHTTLVEHKIDVGEATPIRQRPYRIPFKQRFVVKNM